MPQTFAETIRKIFQDAKRPDFSDTRLEFEEAADDKAGPIATVSAVFRDELIDYSEELVPGDEERKLEQLELSFHRHPFAVLARALNNSSLTTVEAKAAAFREQAAAFNPVDGELDYLVDVYSSELWASEAAA